MGTPEGSTVGQKRSVILTLVLFLSAFLPSLQADCRESFLAVSEGIQKASLLGKRAALAKQMGRNAKYRLSGWNGVSAKKAKASALAAKQEKHLAQGISLLNRSNQSQKAWQKAQKTDASGKFLPLEARFRKDRATFDQWKDRQHRLSLQATGASEGSDPEKRKRWSETLKSQRAAYGSFKTQFSQTLEDLSPALVEVTQCAQALPARFGTSDQESTVSGILHREIRRIEKAIQGGIGSYESIEVSATVIDRLLPKLYPAKP